MHQQQTGAPSCLHATKVLPRSFYANPNHSFQTVYLDTMDQTESIPYRGSNPSPFMRISWNQMPGGGGAPEKQSHKPGATTRRNTHFETEPQRCVMTLDMYALRKSVGQEAGNCCVSGALFIFIKRKWTAATAAKTSYLLAFFQNFQRAEAAGDGLTVDIHRNRTICTCMHR